MRSLRKESRSFVIISLTLIILIFSSSLVLGFSVENFRTAGYPDEKPKYVRKSFTPFSQVNIRTYHKPNYKSRPENLHIVSINGRKAYFRQIIVEKKRYSFHEDVPLRPGSNSIYNK